MGFFRDVWETIKTCATTIANIVAGVATTAATIVAAVAPNPVVKTIATVAAIAIPAITVGVNVVKAVKNKKNAKPETSIEKMLITDMIDDDEVYVDEDVNEFRQTEADKVVYGKKKAKKLHKARMNQKKFKTVDDIKSAKEANRKGDKFNMIDVNNSLDIDSDEMCLDDVVNSIDDDDEVYVDEQPPQGQIYRAAFN